MSDLKKKGKKMPICQSVVGEFYKFIIDDVIGSLREELGNDDVDESVFEDLEYLWQIKLKATNVVTEVNEDEGGTDNDENKGISTGAIPKASTAAATTSASAEIAASSTSMRKEHQDQPGAACASSMPSSSSSSTAATEEAKENVKSQVRLNITLPAQPGVLNAEARIITIQVPSIYVSGSLLSQILTQNLFSTLKVMTTERATHILQRYVNAALEKIEKEQMLKNASDESTDTDVEADEQH